MLSTSQNVAVRKLDQRIQNIVCKCVTVYKGRKRKIQRDKKLLREIDLCKAEYMRITHTDEAGWEKFFNEYKVYLN